MIPVFIAPCISRFDLLDRMLASIDVPVGRGLVIDNARSGHQPNVGPEWRVFSPPFGSLGLPGSINFGIVQTYDAPWWLWASNDLVFSPGDLDAIANLMEAADGQPLVVTYRFAVLALNRAVVQTIGLFDEFSFHPIYFDDTDFARRCSLAGIPIAHDSWGITEGADGFEHSVTVQTNEQLSHANNRTWPVNEAAYIAKWGGRPSHERFDTPWDHGLPLWATRPDLDGRQQREWPTDV